MRSNLFVLPSVVIQNCSLHLNFIWWLTHSTQDFDKQHQNQKRRRERGFKSLCIQCLARCMAASFVVLFLIYVDDAFLCPLHHWRLVSIIYLLLHSFCSGLMILFYQQTSNQKKTRRSECYVSAIFLCTACM